MNRLELRPSANGTTTDWFVDGRALERWLSRWHHVALTQGQNWSIETRPALHQSTAGADSDRTERLTLPSGRTPLYVCRECHDLGCGCFAVRIARQRDSVQWFDFAWDSTLEPVPRHEGAFRDVPILTFDAVAYSQIALHI